MRVELPEFKRCCCCIPLRYGLLTWTYIRIIYLVPMILAVAKSLYVIANAHNQNRLIADIVLQCVFFISSILDVLFNIAFIVGGHTNNVRLLKVQYYYNIVSLVLFVLLNTFLIVDLIFFMHFYLLIMFNYYGIFVLLSVLCILIIGIVIQAYVLLLTRSEIRKLTNNTRFRFVNNAAEAKCVIDITAEPELMDPY